jgi:hypothetical protein
VLNDAGQQLKVCRRLAVLLDNHGFHARSLRCLLEQFDPLPL